MLLLNIHKMVQRSKDRSRSTQYSATGTHLLLLMIIGKTREPWAFERKNDKDQDLKESCVVRINLYSMVSAGLWASSHINYAL